MLFKAFLEILLPRLLRKSGDDALLLGFIGSGGEAGREALAELYQRYHRPLIGSLVRIDSSLSLEDREDLAQGVFVEVWEGRWSHRGETSLLAHLVRRAASRLYNQRRSRSAAQAREWLSGVEIRNSLGLDSQPLDALHVAERQEQVRLALAALPNTLRTSIELIDLQGVKIVDAAFDEREAPAFYWENGPS